MKNKVIDIGMYLVWICLGIFFAGYDLGMEIFPVFGEARVVGLGLMMVPMLGIVYGPLYGSVGALIVAWVGQMLYPGIAFVGAYTFVIAPVVALSCGLIKKRNWFVALILGLLVIGYWLNLVQGVLDTGAMTLVFASSIVGFVVVAGVYGTDFTASNIYFVNVMGNLIIILAGMNTGMLLAAALATQFYVLPSFMWQSMNLYTFLTLTYLYAFLGLLPVLLVRILLPMVGVRLGKEYYWNNFHSTHKRKHRLAK